MTKRLDTGVRGIVSPLITALHELDSEALVQILTQPKNALVRQYRRLFEYEGINLEFTPEALRGIARLALGKGTGARGLRGVMEGVLRGLMYRVPSVEGVIGCRVDGEAVTGGRDIEVIFGKGTVG